LSGRFFLDIIQNQIPVIIKLLPIMGHFFIGDCDLGAILSMIWIQHKKSPLNPFSNPVRLKNSENHFSLI
jgi:hypothetical protein